MTLVSCLMPPEKRLLEILVDTFSLGVQFCQIILCQRIALVCGQAVPSGSLSDIFFDIVAILETPS